MRMLDSRRQQHNFHTLNIVCGYFVRRIQTGQRRQRGHPKALLYYLYIIWIIIITAWICIRPTIHIHACNMLSIIVDITTYHHIQYSIAHRTWVLECMYENSKCWRCGGWCYHGENGVDMTLKIREWNVICWWWLSSLYHRTAGAFSLLMIRGVILRGFGLIIPHYESK